MPSPPTAEIDLCNGALLRIGDQKITTLTDSATSTRERLCYFHYATCRDQTLAAFGWPEALVRAALTAYTEPAFTLTPAATTGTNILFTASGAAFLAGDVGKQLRGDGVPGKATITTFNTTATVHADITDTWGGTSAIASGSWRLYNAIPAWGEFGFSFVKPTGYLAAWRVQNKQRFGVEGQLILSALDTLNIVYVTQLTDVTKYSPMLQAAIETLLAATIAEPVTGSSAKVKQQFDLHTGILRQMRGTVQLSRSPDLLGPYPLVDVRQSGAGVQGGVISWTGNT